jgi:hypothetical protein
MNRRDERYLRRIFPRASRSTLEANGALPDTELECNRAPALDETAGREKTGMARIGIRFTGYRVRPLDPDNFAGSIKALLDGIRHSHLVPDDNFWAIILETKQVKVATFDEEKTEIEIAWPDADRTLRV